MHFKDKITEQTFVASRRSVRRIQSRMNDIRTTFDKLSWTERNKHILSAAKSALTHYPIGKAELIEISHMGNTVKFYVEPQHQSEKFLLGIHYPTSDMPSQEEIDVLSRLS